MARASCTSLVVMHCFKERVEEITFNKVLLTVPQDFQGFCKIFWCFFFFLRREKKENILKKSNHIKSHSNLKVP